MKKLKEPLERAVFLKCCSF